MTPSFKCIPIYLRKFSSNSLLESFITLTGWLSAICLLSGLVIIAAAVLGRDSTEVSKPLRLIATETTAKTDADGITAALRTHTQPNFKVDKPTLNPGMLWISLDSKPCSMSCQILIPNVRVSNVRFWQIGVDKSALSVQYYRSGEGLVINLPSNSKSTVLIGAFHLDNIYPVSAIQRDVISQNVGSHQSGNDREGGLFYGALFTLAFFCAIVATLNRDISFLILGGWLITTCRVVGFNGGWDLYWLGFEFSSGFQTVFAKATLVVHALNCIGLFFSMLKGQVKPKTIYGLCLLACLMICLFFVSSHIRSSTFLVIFWTLAVVSLFASLITAVSVTIKTKLLHFSLFNLSWGLIFLGIIADVMYAVGTVPQRLSFINVQIGAVASGLIMSIAIADKMRRDRSARLAAQRSLTGMFKKFKSLYSNVPLGLCNLDRNFTIVEHNGHLANLLMGNSEVSLRGRNISEIFPVEAVRFLEQYRSNSPDQFEFRLVSGDRNIWLRVNIKGFENRIDCSFENITSRVESEQKLQYLSKHDPLTGCKNRYEFEKDLTVILDLPAIRLKSSVAHVDIKKFKLINDLFGHAIGDQMLKQVAARLTGFVNSKCAMYRLDGDDFFMIFSETDRTVVEHICSRIQEALSVQHYIVNMRAMSLEAGVGIVHLTDNISATDVFASATGASDTAKERADTKVVAVGRGSHDLKQQIEERHLMASMKEKFPEDRLFLDAQPIVNLRDPGNSLAYEVLVRLRGENGGVISPGQFIPAAEKNGLMSQVDRWVLNHLLVWLEHNAEHARLTDFITVNLSGASMNDLRFAEDALAMVKEHRHLASKICFEITESVALLDLRTTLRFVEQTKSFGCKLALDDFGAGYTSFKYLKDIPSDIVKIDGSYVRTINQSTSNHAIVKAISDLTHEMGMMCVAEWIEDVATVKTLRRLGMDYGQGFALCKPKGLDYIAGRKSGFEALTEKPVIDFYQEVYRGSPLKAVPRDIILSAV
jgi:diguanylate cyclase (GGDEF)-like protein